MLILANHLAHKVALQLEWLFVVAIDFNSENANIVKLYYFVLVTNHEGFGPELEVLVYNLRLLPN